MSGQGKKGRMKSTAHNGLCSNFQDVTLADYANSSFSSKTGRLRKSKNKFDVVHEVKKLNIEDKAWHEKLEDFEGDFDFVKEENEDGEEVIVMKKAPRRKKTLMESLIGRDSAGNTYPLDIWHLLANYIRPEDIGTFSAICRNSWSVVNTYTFWSNLYKRYYKNVSNLPARLQPDCMVRQHGLKACVVRSLFHMYPPFVARVERASMGTPYDLKSRQCISMWQERHCNKWRLNFKLRCKNFQPNKNGGEQPDLMEILGDIFANADEGCSILQVVSAERMVPPNVMGLTLHSINMSLDMTMAHMQVGLVFGLGRICNGKLDSSGSVSLSLKTVLQVSVLDWWHPRYPHSNNAILRADDS